MKEKTACLLLLAAAGMLLAGVIVGMLKLWLYAALLGVSAFGYAASALNFWGKNDPS